MENFKSFGRKLTVPFFPGFTAITGPNGSGKSNIADAILFVLGPRSSKPMRAGRLTDLIFNGGKKRKNPANQCKVSLVFDNSTRKMPFDANGNLPEGVDPKLGWAQMHLTDRPIEINQASKQELLHIPGIGPRGVEKLLTERRKVPMKSTEDLRRIGINPSRAAPFILLDGKKPSAQLSFL